MITLNSHTYRRAEDTSLTITGNFLEEFASSDAADLFVRMKACLHTAATISPLIVLVSNNWASGHIGREHLMTVRISTNVFLSLNRP